MAARRIAGFSAEANVRRGGIWWQLDLREGIDLSIYILGGFELTTLRLYRGIVKAGDTVVDIGANIGSHTLPLARLVGDDGRVIAFEPTEFAVKKLVANIALNPDLATRIVTRQVMLVRSQGDTLQPALFSSWPLVRSTKVHSKHRGRLMATTGASATTLDRAVVEVGARKVSLIKLDVDGHELDVLRGAETVLSRDHPLIVMELAPYIYRERGCSFEDLVELLRYHRYEFRDPKTGKDLPTEATTLRALIADGSAINVLASSS